MTAVIAPLNTSAQMSLFPELRPSGLFAGRHWTHCRNGMMGTGVCLAVIGAALNFALQATLTAVTFIALGALLLLSALFVDNSDKQMRKHIEILKIENQQLNLDMQEIERGLGVFVLEYEILKQIGHGMAVRMVGIDREMEMLQQKNDAIQRVIPLLQARVDRNNDENQVIGKQAGLLRQDVEMVVDDGEDLALNEAQESLQDVVALSASIARGQAIAQEIIHAWRRQREELTADLQKMQEEVAGLNHKKVAEEWGAVNRELMEKRAELEQLKQKSAQIHNTLVAEQVELGVFVKRRKEIILQLENMNASILLLDGRIAERRYELGKLDQRIKEKN